jgi:glycerophosphoryl diester phosphodiesterase
MPNPRQHLAAILAGALAALASPAALAWATLEGREPLVIGHRGASGYLPEHTVASYTRAIQQGADFIEPDLVMTRDGQFIARHEPMLGGTTDVAQRSEFASYRTTKMVDGVAVTDWFASDFTLAEIKSLRAIQPRADRDQSFNGLYEVPTFDEVIALARANGVGVYPEIKHSTFHAGIFGANVFEDGVVARLHAAFGNDRSAPVFVQSFETANLRYLAGITDLRLVQLVDADDVKADGSLSLVPPYRQPYDFVVAGDPRTFADLLTPAGLAFVASYADGIGPWKPYVVKTVDDGVDRTGDGKLTINDRRVDGSTGLVERAHANGLLLHTWTFRNDASGYGFADPQAEMSFYFRLGVDGLFTDFPDTGVAARARAVPEPGTAALVLAGLLLVATRTPRRSATGASRL